MALIVETSNVGWSIDEKSEGTKTVTTYSAAWNVTATGADADLTGEDIRLSEELFVEVGTSYVDNAAAHRSSLNIEFVSNSDRPDGVAKIWRVTATYTTDKAKANRSPLWPDTPATIGTTWELIDIPVKFDRDGKLIVNTAQDPPDPPLTIKVPVKVRSISVALSEADFATVDSQAYDQCVNSDTYNGYPPGHCLLQDCSNESFYFENEDGELILGYRVSIRIAQSKDKFNPFRTPSMGFNELYDDDGSDKKRRILLESGEEAQNPVPLDEDGHALFGDDVEDNVHMLEFDLYNEASFLVFDF